jgi:predicted dehydrogenase
VHEPGLRLLGLDVDLVTRDWRAAIERDDVTFVSIATPPATHREIAEAALELGRAVLCEKPLAASLEDAEAMAAFPGRTAVNFSYRALPAFVRAREFLGEVERIDVSWDASSRTREHSPSWKDHAELGGGALAGYGVHALDYAVWLLGPASVRAAAFEGDDDASSVDLACASGASGRIDVSLVAAAAHHRVELHGERTLVLENADATDPVTPFTLTVDGEPVDVPREPRPGGDPRIVPYAVHAAALLAGDDVPTFADGLAAQRLLHAAREAAS